MRLGIDDTKYIVKIIEAILEKEKYGFLCPQTRDDLEKDLNKLKEVIKI